MDTNVASTRTSLDPLQEYSKGVSALQEKLGRILASKQGTMESLSRAAATLRLMSQWQQEAAKRYIQGKERHGKLLPSE